MENFWLREVSYSNAEDELRSIGFDKSYIYKFSDKLDNKNIKIYGLSVAQANILKQTALIYGADCAVNRDVITGNIEKSDAILCGSVSQLLKVAEKLKAQPFKLAILANKITTFLHETERKTKIVGILNITPDSFSDGGLYNAPTVACNRLMQLFEDGADAVDIGAESTRPYSKPVSNKDQIERLKPVLQFIQQEKLGNKISIDTRSSEVADFVLNCGVNTINDVSGFDFDSKMPAVIAKYKARVIIQHSKGKPEEVPTYNNLLDEIYQDLYKKINYAKSEGIEDIVIDPGIGFGKSIDDNIKILDNIETFYSLGCPVMIGHSRKRFLNAQDYDNDIKDEITLAYSYPLIKKNVDFLRVHNVKLHKILISSINDGNLVK